MVCVGGGSPCAVRNGGKLQEEEPPARSGPCAALLSYSLLQPIGNMYILSLPSFKKPFSHFTVPLNIVVPLKYCPGPPASKAPWLVY